MKSIAYWTRKTHRWGAVLTLIPLAVVIASGVLLQLKKQLAWVQPPTRKGQSANTTPLVSWRQLLEAAREVDAAEIDDWDDVERLDVRPGKGVVKVRAQNRWELQFDLQTGQLLSSTYRRSDLIESLHDGSFFADWAKLWVFLPNGLILFGLWATGVYLWLLPWISRRAKARRARVSSGAEAANT